MIWKQEFAKLGKKFDEKQSCLCLTVQPNMPDMLNDRIAEMVFEDFEFDAFTQVSSHSMIHQAAIAENPNLTSQNCHLVIDSGFSFTSIVPFFGGLPLRHATVRIDVGGKLLTNLLTENLSYKEINLKGEGYLVN